MIRRSPPSVLLAIVLLAASGAGAGADDPGVEKDLSVAELRWEVTLDLVESELEVPTVPDELLAGLRPKVEEVQAQTVELAARARARANAVRRLLAALGPAPSADAPPEEPSVASKRAALVKEAAAWEGSVKTAELTGARASQILSRLSERHRAARAQRLFSRGPPPLSWDVVGRAGPHLLDVLGQLTRAPLAAWAPIVAGKAEIRYPGAFLAIVVLTILVVLPARRRILARFLRDRDDARPSFARRVGFAIAVGVARGLLPALIGAVPLAWILTQLPVRGIVADMFIGAAIAASAALFVCGVARATLAPFSPMVWRLSPLADKSASGLYRRIRALAWLSAALFFLEYPATRHLHVPETLGVFYDFATDSVIAFFILLLLPARLWRTGAEAPRSAPSGPRFARAGTWLRFTVGAAALAIPISSLAGFGNLANYLTRNLLLTGVLIGVAIVVHGLARDLIALAIGRDGAERTEAPPEGGALGFWLVAALDAVLAGATLLVALIVWGVAWADLREWLGAAIDGIQIGSFRLSISDLAAAVLVFAVVMAITRWFQRLLEDRVFPRTRLDAGLRNSLKTAAGYVGLVLAVALGIATLGLDLSNVAIIAGALSVGIGFGLQNIVNNFVSGLILLIERPIKVGDWIVVGAHQGHVKQINVRATEIETFQRSSVIIPNSELLSSSLVNWTHKDTMARVDIAVGVSYGSDIDRVRDLLLECARANARVRSEPEPFVLFLEFGESSLDFELRFYVDDADTSFRIASEIRFAIVSTFREAGIEIPFPQRDVHVRDAGALALRPPEDAAGAGLESGPRD